MQIVQRSFFVRGVRYFFFGVDVPDVVVFICPRFQGLVKFELVASSNERTG